MGKDACGIACEEWRERSRIATDVIGIIGSNAEIGCWGIEVGSCWVCVGWLGAEVVEEVVCGCGGLALGG